MNGPPSVSSGQFAGRYAIERELGSGATAIVYLALDTVRGEYVAIKVLRPELGESTAVDRFLREIRLNTRLHHPRILPVLDAGEWGGQLFFVLPFMPDGTLRERLTREKQLPIDEAIEITCVVAEALDHAHQCGLVHRDVKPENILFADGAPHLADFGIARALLKAMDETSTSIGIVRGTPAYMSPEQASGERDYDGRSDIFSLGCVLYEMLAGVPAFIGPSPEAVLAQRFAHPPRDVRVYRSLVSPALEAVVTRALAPVPADRYRTAGELAQALRAAQAEGESRVTIGVRTGTSSTAGRRDRLVAALAIAAASITAVLVFATRAGDDTRARLPSVPLDTTQLVVLPLEVEGASGARTLDDDLLHEALARWRGLSVIDPFQVADVSRRHGAIRSNDDAAIVAASLGAGRFIRGRIARRGSSSLAYAALYDVAGTRQLHQVTQHVPSELAGAAAAFSRLVDNLLLRGARGDTVPSASAAGHSLPAVQALTRAQLALDEWDLATADSSFEAAVRFDPAYARANLWLAQVRAWTDLRAATWSALAERAVAGSDELSSRERELASGLLLLASGRYEEACRLYDRLRQRNSRDFAAWFGLGQCRTMDKIVVADRSSPSGWRFRSSYHQAIAAYTTAFEILPSVHRGYERAAFERLRLLLRVSTDLVTGYGQQDSALFQARPAVLGDTLALIPYPWQMVFSGDPRAIPAGFAKALDRQRAGFRRIAARWSAAYPRSATAKHAVAISLELLGNPAAIDTLRAARRLATDSTRRLQLAAAEVLLRVKFGIGGELSSLRVARALADSLLARPVPTPSDAAALAPVAAAVGRCGLAEQLVRRADPGVRDLPVDRQLLSDSRAMLVRSALGCRASSSIPTLRELADASARHRGDTSTATRRWRDEVLLYRPAILATTLDSVVIGRLAATSKNGLLLAARALTRNDPRAVRGELSAFGAQWRPELGVPTPDIAYPGARLWVSAGDTATAIRWLDMILEGARTYDPEVLADPAGMAAFLSAVVMRADLAAATGDGGSARTWGRTVGVLWSNADPDLQSAVRRLTR
jgi:serine/threonine-protein kinase